MFYYSPLSLVFYIKLDGVIYAVVIIKEIYAWTKLTDKF